MNEAIYTWFERENPDELWAIERLSRVVTFADVYKSMSKGDGLGDDVEWNTDTRTRELILLKMAKLLKMKIEKLIEWSDSKAIAKEKRMLKAQGWNLKKQDGSQGKAPVRRGFLFVWYLVKTH